MPILPTNLAASIAGLPAVARDAKPRRAQPASGRSARRGDDEVIVEPQAAEGAEGVRSVKGNTDEETNEDRHAHEGYTSGGKRGPGVPRPRIDLAG